MYRLRGMASALRMRFFLLMSVSYSSCLTRFFKTVPFLTPNTDCSYLTDYLQISYLPCLPFLFTTIPSNRGYGNQAH